MKAHYRTKDGRITFEVMGESVKDVFKAISEVQAVFEGVSSCGLCHSAAIQFRCREVDGNWYYSMICRDCNGEFRFGQNRDGKGLFPKRQDDEGNPLRNGGWSVWKPKTMMARER